MGSWRSRDRDRDYSCDVCGAKAELFSEIYDPNRRVASRSSPLGRRLNGRRIVNACSPEHLHELQRMRIEPEDWLYPA